MTAPDHDTLIAMFAAVSALSTAINSALLLRLKRGQGEARDRRDDISCKLDQAIRTIEDHERAAASRSAVRMNYDGLLDRRSGPADRRAPASSPTTPPNP